MAELGLAIFSIAIQVGDSIRKLKTFCDNVKEAPDDIMCLLNEIEMLNNVLSQAGSSTASDNLRSLEPAFTSLDWCRQSADILDVVVRDLDGEIRRRKTMGSLKAVLKKGMIEKLKDRLERAKTLLMLAYQMQERELHRQSEDAHRRQFAILQASASLSVDILLSLRPAQNQHTRLVSCDRSSTQEQALPRTSSDSKSLDLAIVRIKKGRSQQQSFMAKLGGPRWTYFTTCAMEFSARKAPAGWDFTIRSYNIVPESSPVIQFARDGNLLEINKIAAIHNHRVELAKFLISQNANVMEDENWPPFLRAVPRGYECDSVSSDTSMEILRILAPMSDFDNISQWQRMNNITSSYAGDSSLFSWILGQCDCSFRAFSLRDRIHYVAKLLLRQQITQSDAARLLRVVFEGTKLDPTVCTTTDWWGTTLLHTLTWNIYLVVNEGIVKPDGQSGGKNARSVLPRPHSSSELLIALREVVSAGSNLHGLALIFSCTLSRRDGRYNGQAPLLRTPLMAVLTGSFEASFQTFRYKQNVLPATCMAIAAATEWLEQLKKSAVDLVAYGRKERKLHLKRRVDKEWLFCTNRDVPCLRLIGFDYGPEPADWHFWFTNVMENYFLEFWEMVNNPEDTLPGAWVEDYEPRRCRCWDYDPEFETEHLREECDIVHEHILLGTTEPESPPTY
ncbi:hypothetical protein LSUE1_G008268 [Lachnellula suecica]|uniref:Fungal N-terminal domain-containing protein n=1 Tax=Lachnellula suecica TaxID=602035 RepID=A0A8T9C2T0_9HELO|nr:hypothetical protein LSUE1_G008268 [Lachnellula suecica]